MSQKVMRSARPTAAALFLLNFVNENSDQIPDTIQAVCNCIEPDPPREFMNHVRRIMTDKDVLAAVSNVLQTTRTEIVDPPGGLPIEEATCSEIDVECEPGSIRDEGEEGQIEQSHEEVVITTTTTSSSVSSSILLPTQSASSSNLSDKPEERSFFQSLEEGLQGAFEWVREMFLSKFENKPQQSEAALNNSEQCENQAPQAEEGNHQVIRIYEEDPEYTENVLFVGVVSLILMAAKCYHPKVAVEITTMLRTAFKK